MALALALVLGEPLPLDLHLHGSTARSGSAHSGMLAATTGLH